MRAGSLAPSTGLDFDRIDRFAGLGWLTFAAQLFDFAQDLAPGDDLLLTRPKDEADFDGRCRGAIIQRVSTEDMQVTLAAPHMLPPEFRYTDRHDQVLTELGWRKEDGEYVALGRVLDQIDDLVGLLIQTLREVYLIARPAELKLDSFAAEAQNLQMPDAPALNEPVIIKTGERAVAVLSAILVELGGRIARGPDPFTFQVRLDQWLAWVHIDKKSPVADVAIVISDSLPEDPVERSRRVAPVLVDLSTNGLRWSRPVVSGQQLLLANSIAISVTSLSMVSIAINGLVADANTAVRAVGSLFASTSDPADRIGNYL